MCAFSELNETETVSLSNQFVIAFLPPPQNMAPSEHHLLENLLTSLLGFAKSTLGGNFPYLAVDSDVGERPPSGSGAGDAQATDDGGSLERPSHAEPLGLKMEDSTRAAVKEQEEVGTALTAWLPLPNSSF